VIAAVLGIAIAAGAVFGGIYKQPNPTSLVWVYVAIWAAIGVIVTFSVRGRESAASVLTDLRSSDTGGA